MSSSWRRTLGNARSFVNNSLGGLRGGTNLASWVVAGTLAYFLWIKPSQDLKREQQVLNYFSLSLSSYFQHHPYLIFVVFFFCRKNLLFLLPLIVIAMLRLGNPFLILKFVFFTTFDIQFHSILCFLLLFFNFNFRLPV